MLARPGAKNSLPADAVKVPSWQLSDHDSLAVRRRRGERQFPNWPPENRCFRWKVHPCQFYGTHVLILDVQHHRAAIEWRGHLAASILLSWEFFEDRISFHQYRHPPSHACLIWDQAVFISHHEVGEGLVSRVPPREARFCQDDHIYPNPN